MSTGNSLSCTKCFITVSCFKLQWTNTVSLGPVFRRSMWRRWQSKWFTSAPQYIFLIKAEFFFFFSVCRNGCCTAKQPAVFAESFPGHWNAPQMHHASSLKIDLRIFWKKHCCSCLFPQHGGPVSWTPEGRMDVVHHHTVSRQQKQCTDSNVTR